MDKYGLVGHPVAHSISPLIHAAFAKATHQKMSYEKWDISPYQFAEAVREFQAKGGKGLNITLPFKIEAYQLATQLSDQARAAGAVNTLCFTENEIYGDNTDGPGLIQDLTRNQHYSLRQKKILVLGAGGAAREIIFDLLKQEPKLIAVSNRHFEKAQELVDKFVMQGNIIAKPLDALDEAFDLIINATSAGITGPFPELPGHLIHSSSWCYDLVYHPKFPSFLEWARKCKPEKCLNGVGMLVEQAALAFYLWRGVMPDTQDIIKASSRA
jgi:shikimate dehydrogenase